MFNPVIASNNIKNEYIDYISTTHRFADEDLQKQFVGELNKVVAQGPYLELNSIFKAGKSINELIDEGILSPLFRDIESKKGGSKDYPKILPPDRRLYLHQEKAVRTIVSGENAIISTGTGSGKTNCFLIPVINELLREQEVGTLGPGVRAIFIYPMNALANDQMKNLREIMMKYPSITFGVYNGATKNNADEALEVYKAMYATETRQELKEKLVNEILSRKEMKETPPNILFTNYSMLEHMLLRPKDDVLFSNADFKFVVLDEAHVYHGATGIETSLLLRRLRARINTTTKTQFILTSATLGDNDDDILTFANNLCGVEFNANDIIRGEREEYKKPSDIEEYPLSMYEDLADEKQFVKDVMRKYGYSVEDGKSEEEILYDILDNSFLYHKMRQNPDIFGINKLGEFAAKLGISLDVATSFISICTKARKNGKPLLDARYHFFIRALEGCYISLAGNGKVFLNRQQEYEFMGEKWAVFEAAICNDCGKFSLVGKIENKHLKQVSKLGEDVDYFYMVNQGEGDVEDDDDDTGNNKEVFYLCAKCGAIVRENELHNLPCEHGKDAYIKVIKLKQTAKGARCSSCGLGYHRRIYLGNDAATSVLATALYEELPEYTYKESADNKTSQTKPSLLLGNILKKKKEKVHKGRQFLVFSDSRQEAARFACYLSSSYKEFLRRRGIYRVIEQESSTSNEWNISEFVKLLTNYFSTERCFRKSNNDTLPSNVDSKRNAWMAVLNELCRYTSSTSLVALGKIQFSYIGNQGDAFDSLVDAAVGLSHAPRENVKALFDVLAFEIVKNGAIETDSSTDLNDEDRQYIFYTSVQRKINRYPENLKNGITGWLPRSRTTGNHSYYSTYKMYLVKRVLGVDEKKAYMILDEYFTYLTNSDYNTYCMNNPNADGNYVMPAKYFMIKTAEARDAKWYRCKKCGHISQFNLDGKCCLAACDGEIEEISAEELSHDNHYAKLYSSERMSPLFVKEHTAQLSKRESAEYQKQFIEKDINALSCSTTFEMGVDVGGLETVFLRDVPPLPSNYIQRAGRAGRSVNAAAFALTFAKLSSHDFAYFKEPKKMIAGKILPPLFKIDNEKIVKRHIYAIALSMFFALHEEQYSYNDANEFLNNKGYLLFIEWLESKPDALKNMIESSIPNIDNLYDRLGIEDYSWLDDLIGDTGCFTELISDYENNVKEFDKQIASCKRKNDIIGASNLIKKKSNYTTGRQLIDFLARGNILPKYGFPVDTVELYQDKCFAKGNESELSLNRDLQMAIAEYAPSAEIIANGKMYTSRYIKKSPLGKDKEDFYIGYIATCPNEKCQAVNFSETPVADDGQICSSCGQVIKKMYFRESIQPLNGFVAEKLVKPVPLTKPDRKYRSEDCYIGNKAAKTIDKYQFAFNGVDVDIESTANDSLLVKSTSYFYVCDSCGFTYADDEHIGDTEVEKQMHSGVPVIQCKKQHERLIDSQQCANTRLKRRTLHHEFKTDVCKLTFGCDTSDVATMLSVMYAILNSVAEKLNIERRDIKGCLSKSFHDGKMVNAIIIYDAVPGGAGHSRRLVTADGRQLYEILMYARDKMQNCTCSPSCYNCLRSYENQKIHDILDRHLAFDFLKQLEGDIIVK